MTSNNAPVTEQAYDPTPRNRRGRRCLAAAAGMATLLTVGLLSAGPAYATATGCHSQNEVGDVALTCIHVGGTGLFVNNIRGSVQLIGYPNPGGPPRECQLNVVAFGTLASGRPYSAQGSTPCNPALPTPSYVDFFPNQAFQANTQVCITATFLGRSEGPVCETILPAGGAGVGGGAGGTGGGA
jgi:hypothetical protein